MMESTSIWISYIGCIAGLIGASAWLAPWVYQKLAKPKIAGKMISFVETTGSLNQSDCLLYFVALNLISLNKTFNIKETKISVKYKNHQNIYSGKIYWARLNLWTMAKSSEQYSIKNPPEQSLPFLGTLPANTMVKVYLTFNVDKATLSEFKEITFTFIEYSNIECNLIIKHEDLDEVQMLFDDEIWIPVNN